MSGVLAGKVCIVTGASRGIGKGIALQLGEAGATVYITGRTLSSKTGDDNVSGSLLETAKEIESRGGKCIPVQCDHSKDEDVKKLFDKVKAEQNGRLDVLVNNAFAGASAITTSMQSNLRFWEEDMGMWDTINRVGLRGHYIASVYAAQMMVPAKQGLIVNISSAAGLMHLVSAPFCIGKSGCDRMASECAIDLKEHNVAFVSLWSGAVRTEAVFQLQTKSGTQSAENVEMLKKMMAIGATQEFAGKAVVHLAKDPNIMKKSGKILTTTSVADEFGFNDVDGRHHMNLFSFKFMLTMSGHTWLAAITPEFLRPPYWMVAAMFHKF